MIKIINPSRLTRQPFFQELIDYLDQREEVILREIKREFVGVANIVYEGIFFFLAVFFMPIMTPEVIRELNAVGNVLLVALALNMLNLTKIKVADLLPAMCIPILYYTVIA